MRDLSPYTASFAACAHDAQTLAFLDAEDLDAAIEFFGHGAIAAHFTSLLKDLRAERSRRTADDLYRNAHSDGHLLAGPRSKEDRAT